MFSANSILCHIDTDNSTMTYEEVTITSQEDIFNLIGDGKVGSVKQVNIDKYHKVFYDYTDEAFSNGVSARVKTYAYHDKEARKWVDFESEEFVLGDKLLLVLCDDKVPIDMTEDAKQFIISCINCQ